MTTTIQNWKNHVEKLYLDILKNKHNNHNKTVEVCPVIISFFAINF